MGRFEEKTINTVLVEENTLLIHFDFDEVSLSEYDRSLLDSLVAEMYRNRRLRLMMEGHTDEQGTAEYNSSLSRERVEEVARYLREKGIPEGIMKLKAFGETSPRAGLTVVNRDALNRRVEIKVMELKR
jgi:outer membrane protein OmpA-like peptidoglycan-associated protein